MIRNYLYVLALTVYLSPGLQGQTFEWGQQFGEGPCEKGLALDVDGAGFLYSASEWGIDVGSGTVRDDTLVTKYDSTGKLIWSRTIGTDDGNDNPFAIATNDSGTVAVVGSTDDDLFATNSNPPFKDSFVVCYDNAGNLLWSTQFGTTEHDLMSSVAIDEASNVYVFGYSDGSLDGTSLGGADAILRKYDANGNLLWARQFGTKTADFGEKLTIDNQGNIVVSGTSYGTFDGVPNLGGSDVFIVKYSATGQKLWSQVFASSDCDLIGGIATNENADIIIGGSIGDFFVHSSYECFLAKYDSAGNFCWSFEFGTRQQDIASGVRIDAAGNILIAGSTFGDFEGTNQGIQDIFCAKFDPDGINLWKYQMGGSNREDLRGFAIDAGSIYMSGGTKSDLFGVNSFPACHDFYLAKLSAAQPVQPQGQKLLDGIVTNGQISDVFESDDTYLEMDPSPTSNLTKQIVDVIYQVELPTNAVSQLIFRVEAKMLAAASAGDVIQSIYLFNYETSRMELADFQPVGTSDTVVEVTASGDLSRFVAPLHNEVTAQISWRSPEFSGSPYTWSIDLDQAIWVIE